MRGNFFVKYRRTRSEPNAPPSIITRKISLKEHLYLVFDEEGTKFCSEQEEVSLVNSEVNPLCRGKEAKKSKMLKL